MSFSSVFHGDPSSRLAYPTCNATHQAFQILSTKMMNTLFTFNAAAARAGLRGLPAAVTMSHFPLNGSKLTSASTACATFQALVSTGKKRLLNTSTPAQALLGINLSKLSNLLA